MKKPITFIVFIFIVQIYLIFVCCKFVISSGLVVFTFAALSVVCKAFQFCVF